MRDLHRRALTAECIAERLNASLDDVIVAHRMLDLPVNDTDEPIRYRTDAEREAEIERIPQRMQERSRRTNLERR